MEVPELHSLRVVITMALQNAAQHADRCDGAPRGSNRYGSVRMSTALPMSGGPSRQPLSLLLLDIACARSPAFSSS